MFFFRLLNILFLVLSKNKFMKTKISILLILFSTFTYSQTKDTLANNSEMMNDVVISGTE